MPKLILIKHASPEVVPGVPSEEWHLSERGRASCAVLAEKLRPYGLTALVSSEEPKAAETAELIATVLAIPHRTAADLHEHDRSNVPHMRSSEFISTMELFFRRPDELVLGRETARQAEERISDAIDDVLKQFPEKTLGIVTHGTVLALFLAMHSDRPPFALWRELGLPSFAVLDLPSFRVIEIAAKVQL